MCRAGPPERRPSGRAGALLPPFRRRGSGRSALDGRTLAVQTDTGIEIVDVARMRIRGYLLDSETTVPPPRSSATGSSPPPAARAGCPSGRCDITPRLAATRRARRRRRRPRHQPGRAHTRLRRHRRRRPPVRRRHAATAGRPPPGRAGQPDLPVFSATAPTRSRPLRPGMATAGTSARPPGSGAPAPSPPQPHAQRVERRPPRPRLRPRCSAGARSKSGACASPSDRNEAECGSRRNVGRH